MKNQTITETQLSQTEAWAILEEIMDCAGKPISEEYRYGEHCEGTPIDIIAECEAAEVGELRCHALDESVIHAYGITQEEIDKHSIANEKDKHWSGLFMRILAARKAAFNKKRVSR